MSLPHILIAVGARPNFMKAAPLLKALRATRKVRISLIHTGQHYDRQLSSYFLRDLGLPRPAFNLRVGSGSHAAQTAEIMRRFERVLLRTRPDAVVVVGDVNSTLACGLTAWKIQYPEGTPANPSRLRPLVVHVEAGLRSLDRSMPEEVNRKVVDHLADLLFAPSPDAVENLRREGIPSRRIFFAGNVMIDSLRSLKERAQGSPILRRLRLRPRGYAVVTLHRPSNVDELRTARQILSALAWLGRRLPVVFPLHPRTRQRWQRHGLLGAPRRAETILFTAPLGYLDFLKLMASARLVLTDSGGIQEETTVLRVPCLTLRTGTERPITITQGTNRLVGTQPRRIIAACETILDGQPPRGRIPPRWDGQAAERISRVLIRHLTPP